MGNELQPLAEPEREREAGLTPRLCSVKPTPFDVKRPRSVRAKHAHLPRHAERAG